MRNERDARMEGRDGKSAWCGFWFYQSHSRPFSTAETDQDERRHRPPFFETPTSFPRQNQSHSQSCNKSSVTSDLPLSNLFPSNMVKHGRDKKRRAGRTGRTRLKVRRGCLAETAGTPNKHHGRRMLWCSILHPTFLLHLSISTI